MTTQPVPTCTDDLLEEIEHYWPEELVGMGELVVYLSDYQKLQDRLHAAEKDAGRYRWLSENSSVILNQHARFKAESGTLIESTMPSRRELNSAIDAAMEAKQ